MTRGMLVTVLALTLGVTADDLDAQKGAGIVGTWKLLSASASTADGVRNDSPYGPGPAGMLIYTADGRMMAIISHSGRSPFRAIGLRLPQTKEPTRSPAFLRTEAATH